MKISLSVVKSHYNNLAAESCGSRITLNKWYEAVYGSHFPENRYSPYYVAKVIAGRYQFISTIV